LALAFKGIDYEYVPVNLLKGEQKSEEYTKKNPSQEVPALEVDGRILCQSVAIIEFLEEKFKKPKLYPSDPVDRAIVRQMAEIVTSDTQPVQNMRVLEMIESKFKGDKAEWAKFWIENGLKALETVVQQHGGKYCFGDEITVADICLIPQMYNANRFKCDMSQFPKLVEINERLKSEDAVQKSSPENQVDNPDKAPAKPEESKAETK